ncbi:MAG: 5'/3'-nucleotidase SurE [Desulfobacterales bacterium]|nr:MAG: 5'/3'-nucleotidase SurE [Desulfobacterales bacterium]
MCKPTILVTNDDGIHSPGLKAAAEAVQPMGKLIIAAPRRQQTGMGRSLTGNRDARLEPVDYQVNGYSITAFHCECSPALVVRHSLKTIFADNMPDLLISGINYGENLGFNITCSGTVGAALEAASFGIPAIAISKQTEIESHYSHNLQDWSAASSFLAHFSRLMLTKRMPQDVDVLKIDIPMDATPNTPWKLTKLARVPYFSRVLDAPTADTKIGDGRTEIRIDPDKLEKDTDIHTVAVDNLVSITPLSTDISSRVRFSELLAVLDS